MAASSEYIPPPPPPMAGSQVNSVEFPLPPTKRPRLSPQPTTTTTTTPYPQAQGTYPQHVSPYANPSPSAAQSTALTTPPYNSQNSASASPRYNQPSLPHNHSSIQPSPHFSNIPPSQNTYTTPYSNGNTPAPTSALSPQVQFPVQNNFLPQNYGVQNSQSPPGQNQFTSHSNSYIQNISNPSNPMAGNMGPPMKPAEKLVDEDQTDVLTGTGVNLREEEAYSQSQFTFSQNPTGSQSAGYSSQNLAPYVAGPEAAFYGSGKVSQPAESSDGNSQAESEHRAAEEAWHVAARNLADSRQEELGDPFSQPKFMMFKMDQIAREAGIKINTRDGSMGRLIVPGKDYDVPIQVKTAPGSHGIAIMATDGRILPADNLVVDQLILLSLAAKHRTRQLVENVVRIAKGRQVGSSGFVPSEWADLAVPANGADGTVASTDPNAPRLGWESAVNPRANQMIPLKRSHSTANRLPTPVSDGTKTPVSTKSFTNELAKALRDSAETERQFEEERIRKRNARKDSTLRNGSVAPGTPGSVVSNVGATAMKAPTRKEIEKKTKEKKKEDAASNVSANATSNMFLGNMGGKKGKKTYSWMTSGPNVGSPNPAYSMAGAGGIRSAVAATAAAQETPAELTQRSQTRLGSWREDKPSGHKVQMRDWIAVLEYDGRASQELQRALMWLDGNTRPKKDTPESL